MKIKLFFLLFFFLFGSLTVDDLSKLNKDSSTYLWSSHSQHKLSIEFNDSHEILSEDEVDHNINLDIDNHYLQNIFLKYSNQNRSLQIYFLKRYVGGHSGLSPPSFLIS